MGEEWNWFFSAVAQSAAAICAIIGAFVFSKYVNLEGESDSILLAVQAFKNKSDYIKKQYKSEPVRKYIQDLVVDGIMRLRKQVLDAKNVDEATALHFERGFSSLTTFSERERLLKKAFEFKSENGGLPGGLLGMLDHVGKLDPVEKTKVKNRFYDLEEKLLLHLKEGEILGLRILALTKAIRVVEFSLRMVALLFVVGVLYPLHFLPIASGEELHLGWPHEFIQQCGVVRGLILALVAVLFGGSLAWLNYRLRTAVALKSDVLGIYLSRLDKETYYPNFMIPVLDDPVESVMRDNLKVWLQ